MNSNFDFVAVGDIVADAFIRLSEAHVDKHKNNESKELCIRYGAKIPYDSVEVVYAVGNCANAGVAAARLGLSSALLSNQGKDGVGERNLESLKANNVSTDLVTTHEGIPSNYHYVLLYKADRTILVKHQVYPYVMPDIGSPKWLYLTSLGETSLAFHGAIASYLAEHPDIKLVFQPGTFQIRLGKDKLAEIYKHSYLFFCNKDEAQEILGVKEQDVKNLMESLRSLGPKIVCVTDGPDGAYAMNESGEARFMPPYPDPADPLDRTGAGDAFASTFATALALGKSVSTALAWAPINSMSVVQKIGAQAGLLTRDKLEQYLTSAPGSYQSKKI